MVVQPGGHLQTLVADKTARKYEPVEDEISLAGIVDMLLWHIWRCIDMYDQGPKLGMRRKRNCAEDSATVKGKRPDFFLLSSRALLFKGEDKTSEAELEKALEELSTKLKEWGAAVHGKVEYLLRAEEEHQVYTSCAEAGLRPFHTNGTYQKGAARVVHSTMVNKL
ncbi:hypothetical protein WJX82_003660 [Trebouxia sp. C0006]